MREPNTEPTKEALVEEQTRVHSVSSWSKCIEPLCETRCPGARCDDCKPSSSGVGTGVATDQGGIDSIQTSDIIDDLVNGETEHTSVLHRVDNLRIVRLDDVIGTEYRIEEREAGSWKRQTTLTRDQLLLAAGMVNKRWGDD